jgi:hypothetical protein
MHALPLVLSLAGALILAPSLLRALNQAGHTRANYRDRQLAFPFGVLALVSAVIALIPLMLLEKLGSVAIFYPTTFPIAIYALGVLAVGLVDDTLGCDLDVSEARGEPRPAPPRGWRGHWAATRGGEFSTGALKAAGSLGLALLAMDWFGLSNVRWLLAAAVLVLATNVFNLLDLRPGRSMKAFVVLGAGLSVGASEIRPLWALGLFVAPALIAGAYDLRERAMLGDTGANLLGALAGLWLVLTLSETGQIVALVLLAAITLYGELRSISAVVERTPVLRQLDSWGRPT